MHRPGEPGPETDPREDPPDRPRGAPLAAAALLAGMGTIAEATRGVSSTAAGLWMALLAVFAPWLVARVARAAWWAERAGEAPGRAALSAAGAAAVPIAFAAGCLALLPAGPYEAPWRILAGALAAAGPGLGLAALGIRLGRAAARAGIRVGSLLRAELGLALLGLFALDCSLGLPRSPLDGLGEWLAGALAQPVGRLTELVPDPLALGLPLAGLLLLHLAVRAGSVPLPPLPEPASPPGGAAPLVALRIFLAEWGVAGPAAVGVAGLALMHLGIGLAGAGLEPESALFLAELALASLVTQAAPLWVPGPDEAPPPRAGPGAAADHGFRIGMIRAVGLALLIGLPTMAAGLLSPVLALLFLAESLAFALPTIGLATLGRHCPRAPAGALYLLGVVPWVMLNLGLDWLFVPVVRAKLELGAPTVELWMGLKALSLGMASVLGAYCPLLHCAEEDSAREVSPCPTP